MKDINSTLFSHDPSKDRLVRSGYEFLSLRTEAISDLPGCSHCRVRLARRVGCRRPRYGFSPTAVDPEDVSFWRRSDGADQGSQSFYLSMDDYTPDECK